MTKQEFLNTPAKTPVDGAAQVIITTNSMTSLKQLSRDTKALYKALYKEEHKNLPFRDIMAAIEKAMFFIID